MDHIKLYLSCWVFKFVLDQWLFYSFHFLPFGIGIPSCADFTIVFGKQTTCFLIFHRSTDGEEFCHGWLALQDVRSTQLCCGQGLT